MTKGWRISVKVQKMSSYATLSFVGGPHKRLTFQTVSLLSSHTESNLQRKSLFFGVEGGKKSGLLVNSPRIRHRHFEKGTDKKSLKQGKERDRTRISKYSGFRVCGRKGLEFGISGKKREKGGKLFYDFRFFFPLPPKAFRFISRFCGWRG